MRTFGEYGISWSISPRALPPRWCRHLVFAAFVWPPGVDWVGFRRFDA
jgi:hypothetical protein